MSALSHSERVSGARKSEVRLLINDNEQARKLLGRNDENIKIVESAFNVRVIPRGNELLISGASGEVETVTGLFRRLLEAMSDGRSISSAEFRYAVDMTKEGDDDKLDDLFSDVILVSVKGKQIRPRTFGQKAYVNAIRQNDLVLGIGPAGTGKTFLAVAVAIASYRERAVEKIVLTRPAVEAGERLGFLPGDIEQKVNPYLRPLYDALFEMLGVETYQKYVARGVIEVAPLAYMRGRTLDDAFVILDEAQNTTPEQMKMFLTRLGVGSKAVVTGDISQVDLPKGIQSGLDQARQILDGVEGVATVYLTEKDVVRHELVQRIIRAYERWEKRSEADCL